MVAVVGEFAFNLRTAAQAPGGSGDYLDVKLFEGGDGAGVGEHGVTGGFVGVAFFGFDESRRVYKPWMRWFLEDAALPVSLVGPVLFCAFAWLAAVCLSVA